MSSENPNFDEIEATPGNTTSLLRTVVGTSLRRIGGWIAVADLVTLMRAIDIPDTRTRNTISRLKAKGLVLPLTRDRALGYELNPAAVPMLEKGDERIYHPRSMAAGERWCLISYSVPEENRDLRHQLRRRLSWIGCGSASPALWICPEYRFRDVEEILADLGLSARATVFMADEVRGAKAPQVAVALWWDLDGIAALHHTFLDLCAKQIPDGEPSPREAFATWIRCLDAWRVIPYRDPGLPSWLLPDDWPARQSIPVFLDLRDRIRPLADAFVDEVTAGSRVPIRPGGSQCPSPNTAAIPR
ncbi:MULTISPECIES: PaaX family transcriptional regulator C-terminal domain-containing protein [unclassified Micromonospora]|uniref:PaaX family transcriptional regulator n=1 Tax=unclassified Micromonospora TaxID=2617518 RepID=UPI003638BB10